MMTFSGAKSRLGIEFSEDYVTIAILSNVHGKDEIPYIESIPVKEMSDQTVIDLLASTVKQTGLKNYEAILVISVKDAITKSLQIPSTIDSEIRDILNLQAGRQTPYSREELVIDYVNLGQYQGVYTKVFVAMVTTALIKKKYLILESAGIKVSKILFSADGVGAFCGKMLGGTSPESASAILNLNVATSDISIFCSRGLLFTRNIPIGEMHLSHERDAAMLRLVDEIKKTLEAYLSEEIASLPEALYIARDNDKNAILVKSDLAGAGIDVREYVIGDHILIKGATTTGSDALPRPSYVSLIMSLVSSDTLQISLIPEDVKLQRKFESKARRIITAGVLVMVIFFQICLIFISKMYFKEKYLNMLKKSYQSKVSEAGTLHSISEKTRVLKKYISERDTTVDTVARLYEILPEEIYLKGVTFDNEGKVEIKGTSKSMSRIFQFVTQLENDPLFSQVKTEYTENRKEGNEDVADFGIVMTLEGHEQTAKAGEDGTTAAAAGTEKKEARAR